MDGWVEDDPAGDRRFLDLPGPFRPERGGVLPGVRVSFETWGTLDEDGGNADYLVKTREGLVGWTRLPTQPDGKTLVDGLFFAGDLSASSVRPKGRRTLDLVSAETILISDTLRQTGGRGGSMTRSPRIRHEAAPSPRLTGGARPRPR